MKKNLAVDFTLKIYEDNFSINKRFYVLHLLRILELKGLRNYDENQCNKKHF